eukprot:tig00021462_g21588.t1
MSVGYGNGFNANSECFKNSDCTGYTGLTISANDKSWVASQCYKESSTGSFRYDDGSTKTCHKVQKDPEVLAYVYPLPLNTPSAQISDIKNNYSCYPTSNCSGTASPTGNTDFHSALMNCVNNFKLSLKFGSRCYSQLDDEEQVVSVDESEAEADMDAAEIEAEIECEAAMLADAECIDFEACA